MTRQGLMGSVKRIIAGGDFNAKKVIVSLLGYILLLAGLMQPVIAHGCSETYMGGPGDQSAFVWLYEASPDSPPLWGPTKWSNAPYGEDLREPFFVTGLLPYTAVWLMSKVIPPTCAYNIQVGWGYLFTAGIMFFFILWLTNRKSYFVAWLAGVLLAFSPYLQIKTMHHISYVYAGILVLLLWLLLIYWRKPSYLPAIGVMLVSAWLFYHDPYFIMLGIFLIAAVMIGLLIDSLFISKVSVSDVGRRIKPLLICLPVLMMLILPVVFIRLAYSGHIERVVGDSRDTNIIAEGRAYSSRPWEFVLPATTNPFVPGKVTAFQMQHQHGTDNIETTLFVGYTVLFLSSVCLYAFLRHSERLRGIVQDARRSVIVLTVIAVTGLIMSLPPYVTVMGVRFYFPSWLLLHITSMWRMPARFFVILHIALVALAAIGLLYILKKYHKQLRGWRSGVLFIIIGIVAFTEFLTFNPLDRKYWSYKMVPESYTEIHNDPAIDRIAEYPLLDPPRNFSFIFYLSYQAYHEKSMINSAKAASPTKKYRESMSDLYDWQTLGSLKQLGVDRVVVHGNNAPVVGENGLVNAVASYDNQTTTMVNSFAIASDVMPLPYLLTISDGFDGPSNYGFKDIDFYMHQRGVLKPVLLPGAEKRAAAMVRLEYYAFEKTPRRITITQKGKEITQVYPTEQKNIVEFTIDPTHDIVIVPENPPKDYSFVISNMMIY